MANEAGTGGEPRFRPTTCWKMVCSPPHVVVVSCLARGRKRQSTRTLRHQRARRSASACLTLSNPVLQVVALEEGLCRPRLQPQGRRRPQAAQTARSNRQCSVSNRPPLLAATPEQHPPAAASLTATGCPAGGALRKSPSPAAYARCPPANTNSIEVNKLRSPTSQPGRLRRECGRCFECELRPMAERPIGVEDRSVPSCPKCWGCTHSLELLNLTVRTVCSPADQTVITPQRVVISELPCCSPGNLARRGPQHQDAPGEHRGEHLPRDPLRRSPGGSRDT